MKYKIKLITPGIIVELPHNKRTIRTPHEFIIEEKDKMRIESLIRIKGISSYEISPTDEIEKVNDAIVPTMSIKRQKSETNLNIKFN